MRNAILIAAVLVASHGKLAADPPPDRDLTSLSIEELMNVTVKTAALHEQTISDAPASVTVVTQQQIRQYGYRTLAEVIASVGGFYDSYDRSFHNPGVRGFSLPGDYGTRMLVLIDGNNCAAIGNGSNGFGQDFPLDLSLVKQIEIVKGPTSALYGSSGILATVNVITKLPAEGGALEARMEIDSLGEKKLQVSSPVKLGRDARLLLSGSLFNNAGERSIYISELDAPEFNFGRAINMDGERGYRLFGNLAWKNWRALAVVGEDLKIMPLSWGPTAFNDRGTRTGIGFVMTDLAYTREWSGKIVEWHTYYNAFRFRGYYHYPLEQGIEDARERDADDWGGSQLSLRLPVRHVGSLTLGIEGRLDLRTLMSGYDVQPVYAPWFSIDKPDQFFAVFAQDEIALSKHWRVDLGVRRDESRRRPEFLSPRAALIYHPTSATSYKFLYGRSFRSPTTYEMFYDDGFAEIANLALRPEKDNTFEFVAEHRFAKRLQTSVSLYHYRMDDMIIAEFAADNALQFQNAGSASASGLEAEAALRLVRGLELGGSMAFQRTVDQLTHYPFPNSPGQVGKLRGAIPLLRNRLTPAASLQYLGKRQTNAGNTLGRVFLPDVTISSNHLTSALDLQFGVRNLLNRRYHDPVALLPAVDSMPNPGRTVFLALIWRAPETWTPSLDKPSKKQAGAGQ